MKINIRKNISFVLIILFIFSNFILLDTKVKNNFPNTITDTNQLSGESEKLVLDQDEWHTLFLGMYRSYNKDFSEIRVGSTTRNLILALSPFAVFYMNTQLGGEHTIVGNLTHSYAGYSYIERTIENFQGNTYLVYLYDPNLQNFRYFLVFLRNIIFILTVALIASYFFRNSNKAASFIFVGLSFLNPLTLKDSINLYTDMTNYILLNFLILNLLFFNYEKILSYISIGLICSLLVGNSIGNLLLIPIILIYIVIKNLDKIKKLLTMFFSFIFSYIFLNIYELSVSTGRPRGIEYIDQQLWNIWHYQTGHYFITPSGVDMVRNVFIDQVPYTIFPLLIFLYKIFEIKKIRDIFLILSLCQILLLLATFANHIYSPEMGYRNLSAIFAFGIFCFCLLISVIENKYSFKYVKIIIVGVIVSLSISNTYQEFVNKNIDYNILSNKYKCENIGGQDTPKNIDIEYDINFEISQKILASELETKYTKALLENNIDCVFIKSSRSNKFLTNFLLLKDYELKFRHASYMFFVNKNILTEEFAVR